VGQASDDLFPLLDPNFIDEIVKRKLKVRVHRRDCWDDEADVIAHPKSRSASSFMELTLLKWALAISA
jgi:hypothetical protein